MTTNLPETEILKTDVMGRVRTRPERREAILDEFEKSGVAGLPFAKMIGVKYPTFASWVRKRRLARGHCDCLPAVNAARPMKFAEAVVATDASEKTMLLVELPGGARVQVHGLEQMDLLCCLLTRLIKTEHGHVEF